MNHFALQKTNYIIMLVAVFLLFLGFVLMYGKGTEVKFDPSIFDARRITVAPISIMIGFVTMIFGIMWKPKNHDKK